MKDASIVEVCILACAEVWRGDGEVLASPIGVIPTLGARLAAATFEPSLLLTDGEALLIADNRPGAAPVTEGWLPFPAVFDMAWSGRRHVLMGAAQLDRFGNQNISCIGPWLRPTTQLLGARGAPGNTVNHPTSYWIPNHSRRVFVENVDFVCGVGHDRAAAAGRGATRFHDVRRVVTNMGVLDFDTPNRQMRLRSVHPGVTISDIARATGFDLVVPDVVPETRQPSIEDLELIRNVLDPDSSGAREIDHWGTSRRNRPSSAPSIDKVKSITTGHH